MQWLVLERLARGASRAAIAAELGIAPSTVSRHLEGIYRRLPLEATATRRMAAITWYLREGRRHRAPED
jgi:DNA-binding NarL/FixJ family response regulator